MHALLVDDEVDFLELMEKRLSRRNITVTTASDGATALAHVQRSVDGASEPITVVVLDVRMPGMDGLETLRKIKQIAPTLPVILLTGHAAVGVAMEGLELGAFDYMLKPMPITDLISKMQEAQQTRAED